MMQHVQFPTKIGTYYYLASYFLPKNYFGSNYLPAIHLFCYRVLWCHACSAHSHKCWYGTAEDTSDGPSSSKEVERCVWLRTVHINSCVTWIEARYRTSDLEFCSTNFVQLFYHFTMRSKCANTEKRKTLPHISKKYASWNDQSNVQRKWRKPIAFQNPVLCSLAN